MTHPDLRAALERLIEQAEYTVESGDTGYLMADITAAHTALAAEPRWGIRLTPPPDLLRNAVSEWSALPLAKREALSLADHVATAAYQAGARAALAAEPGQGAPSEKALEVFSDYFRHNYPGPDTIIHKPDWHTPKIFWAAADAIARYSAQPAPVPVAERLPGEGDMDGEGRCWWWAPKDPECPLTGHDSWGLYSGACIKDTHWLPYWALPLPEAQP